jgi:hypothetical protein
MRKMRRDVELFTRLATDQEWQERLRSELRALDTFCSRWIGIDPNG